MPFCCCVLFYDRYSRWIFPSNLKHMKWSITSCKRKWRTSEPQAAPAHRTRLLIDWRNWQLPTMDCASRKWNYSSSYRLDASYFFSIHLIFSILKICILEGPDDSLFPQVARRQIHILEDQNQVISANERQMKSHIRALELERAALLSAVTKLRQLVPPDILAASAPDIDIPAAMPTESTARSPIHNPLVERFLEGADVNTTCNSLTELDREVASLMAARRKEATAETTEIKKCRKAPKVRLTLSPSNAVASLQNYGPVRGRPASANS